MINLDAPKFAFGPGQSIELALTLPVSPFVRSLAPAVGGDLEGDSGLRTAYVIQQDELLSFVMRFYETEWPDIVAMIDIVMDGQPFLFYPVASQDESYFVTLESPAVGMKYEPVPEGGYPRVFMLDIVLAAPSFDGAVTEIREFQADFETPDHLVEAASTTRRPDAISFDYLRAAAPGPVAQGDVSQGPAVKKWMVRASGNQVFIARENAAGTDWDAEVELFNYANAVADPILELDFAFTQSGNAVVCAERASGLWLFWYDPIIPGNTFVNLGAGRTPKCLLDDLDPRSISTDVLLFYINDAVNALCYRVQSERYATEHATPVLGDMVLPLVGGGGTITLPAIENLYVEDAVRTEDGRVMVVYSGRDPTSGVYMVQTLTSGLYPLIMQEAQFQVNAPTLESGILQIVLIIVEPPGTSPTQYPNVYAMPDETGADVSGPVLFSGALFNNTMLVLVEGDAAPTDVPVGRYFFSSVGDGGTGTAPTLVSGIIVANVIAVIPTGSTPPSNVEAIYYEDPTEAGAHMNGFAPVLQSGLLQLIVITTTAYDTDGIDVTAPRLMSGFFS